MVEKRSKVRAAKRPYADAALLRFGIIDLLVLACLAPASVAGQRPHLTDTPGSRPIRITTHATGHASVPVHSK
jgi:hypothetical protein